MVKNFMGGMLLMVYATTHIAIFFFFFFSLIILYFQTDAAWHGHTIQPDYKWLQNENWWALERGQPA